MNPLELMNNDMATLILGSRKIFERWDDDVAERMKSGCIESVQRDWNAYMKEMNDCMNLYMRAEREIDEAISEYEKKIK